ncbi:MAG: sugar phosphate isomerase/epimerase [Chloroflexi bacterium]|nr:sugar phosphate isomerase/epimerase [Chloroflexota bacterium]
MKLSLAIQTPEVDRAVPVALLSGSFDERLRKARALGADGVELMTANPRALDANAVADMLQANGLEAAAVGSGAVAFSTGLTLLSPDLQQARQARERLTDLIDFATAVRAPVVTIGSFRGRLAHAGPSARQDLVIALRDGAGYAESKAVRLAVEPINRYESDIVNSAAGAMELVGDVSHSALGIILDTFHVNIEETSWTEPFEKVMAAGLLWHVHLGDNNRLYPGQGLIDFPAIVSTLQACGYNGYLSAELLALPDPDTAAAETMRYMRSLVGGRP